MDERVSETGVLSEGWSHMIPSWATDLYKINNKHVNAKKERVRACVRACARVRAARVQTKPNITD